MFINLEAALSTAHRANNLEGLCQLLQWSLPWLLVKDLNFSPCFLPWVCAGCGASWKARGQNTQSASQGMEPGFSNEAACGVSGRRGSRTLGQQAKLGDLPSCSCRPHGVHHEGRQQKAPFIHSFIPSAGPHVLG